MIESTGSQIPIEFKAGVEKCFDKYKTYDVFLSKLNLDTTDKLMLKWKDEMICPIDTSGQIKVPTVYIASLAFGRERIMAWIMSYIVNVNSFFLGANVEKKMTPSQMEDAANVILQNYGNLYVSEVPVVFSRIKGGKYGKAYGVVDGGMICNCFELYFQGRKDEQAEIFKKKEDERIRKRNEEWSKQKRYTSEEFKKTVEYAEIKVNGRAEQFDEFVKKFGFEIDDVRHD